MINKLSDEEVDHLLREQIVGHLGCHAEGRTYVVPLSYAYDGHNIYAHTHDGMKMQIMRKNPNVCFQVDDKKNLDRWQSAIIWGEFEEITDPEGRHHALKVLTGRQLPLITSETMHLGSIWPFSDENLGTIKGIFFRINIQEKTGRFEVATNAAYRAF